MHFPSVPCVGVHFRGSDIKTLVSSFTVGQALQLQREPDNPYDANAVKVMLNDIHCGYVAKNVAAWMAPHLDEGAVPTAVIEEMTEDARGNPLPLLNVNLASASA